MLLALRYRACVLQVHVLSSADFVDRMNLSQQPLLHGALGTMNFRSMRWKARELAKGEAFITLHKSC